MNNSATIIQVDTIENYNIHPSLLEELQEIDWRIQAKKFIELFVYCPEKVIEGIGLSWTNPNHPTAKYIKVITINQNKALMDQLLKNVVPFNKFIYSCNEEEIEKIAFLYHFGFKLFRKTYMESYRIEDLLNKLHNENENKSFVSLQEVLKNPALEEELFRLLKLNYEQTHLDNEAKDVSWQTWREHLLSDDPDLQISKVAIENNEVVGYIFVHPMAKDHCDIGWIGKKKHVNLFAMLKAQLVELHFNQFETVEFEIDTTDYFAYEFAKLLELDQKSSWNSYLLNSPHNHHKK